MHVNISADNIVMPDCSTGTERRFTEGHILCTADDGLLLVLQTTVDTDF